MKVAPQKTLTFGKRRVDYRLVRSKSARKLRVRVGPEGVEVVQPVGRTTEEFEAFLESRQDWIIRQIERVERFRSVRKPLRKERGEILYRGKPTLVRVEDVPRHRGTNRVLFEADGLVVIRGRRSRTSPAQSLENWLRKQARQEIHRHLDRLTVRIGRHPRRVYVMGQRTKWGNCSSLQNLSFNWRLIMAPDFVLRYLVTHGRFMYLCWVLPNSTGCPCPRPPTAGAPTHKIRGEIPKGVSPSFLTFYRGTLYLTRVAIRRD